MEFPPHARPDSLGHPFCGRPDPRLPDRRRARLTQSIGESDFTSFYGAATLLREGHGAGIYNPALQQSMHAALVFPDRIGNLPFVDPPAAAAILVP